MNNFTPRQSLLAIQAVGLLCACLLFSGQSVAQAGRVDLLFGNKLDLGAIVYAIDIQPDGKTLIAGDFRISEGGAERRYLARLNTDNSLDTTFDIGTYNGPIRRMVVQASGKILIGPPLSRRNSDGSIDSTFQSGNSMSSFYDLDVQTDGKVLVSGNGAIGTPYVERRNANGSLDNSFAFSFFGTPHLIDVTQDDKVLIAVLTGNFTYTVNQNSCKGLARLRADGSLDTSFCTVIDSPSGLKVEAEELGDRSILVWGSFTSVNGVSRRNLAMLNPDGSLITSFNPATGSTNYIFKALRQTDGRILLLDYEGGPFFAYDRIKFLRLNSDGSLDNRFSQGRGTVPRESNGGNVVPDWVRSVRIRNGNKLIVGGAFYRYNGLPRSGLVQLGL